VPITTATRAPFGGGLSGICPMSYVHRIPWWKVETILEFGVKCMKYEQILFHNKTILRAAILMSNVS